MHGILTTTFYVISIRYAENVNQHIGALGNKVEEQLKEINKKCSELQKQENRVRKCLKKLSANSRKGTDEDLQKSRISKNESHENCSNSNRSSLHASEEDYIKNIDYNRIIKNAMKNCPESVKQKPSKCMTSYDLDDCNIIDVDAVCRFDEGIQTVILRYFL